MEDMRLAMTYYVLQSKYEGATILDRPKIPGDLQFDRGRKETLDLSIIEFVMDKNAQGELHDLISTHLPGLTVSAKVPSSAGASGRASATASRFSGP